MFELPLKILQSIDEGADFLGLYSLSLGDGMFLYDDSYCMSHGGEVADEYKLSLIFFTQL